MRKIKGQTFNKYSNEQKATYIRKCVESGIPSKEMCSNAGLDAYPDYEKKAKAENLVWDDKKYKWCKKLSAYDGIDSIEPSYKYQVADEAYDDATIDIIRKLNAIKDIEGEAFTKKFASHGGYSLGTHGGFLHLGDLFEYAFSGAVQKAEARKAEASKK